VTPEREDRMRAISAAHDQMEADFLAVAVFDPDRSYEGSDYNQHYLDYSPPPAAEEAFQTSVSAVLDAGIVASHPEAAPVKAILSALQALASGDQENEIPKG
jgi:hypothetical protein